MKKVFITSVLCASVVFAASEKSENYNYEITPFVSGILSDSKIDLNDDNYANIGIALAKRLDIDFIDQVEAAYARSENLGYKDNSLNTNVNRYFLNGIKNFPLSEKVALYGLAGFGYQDVTAETTKHQDNALFNYGLGLKYDISYYGIALKTDVRHLVGLQESQNDVMYTVGLAMPLGKKSMDVAPVVPAVVEQEAAPVVDGDDDGDGVYNSLDLCPNTRKGVAVDRDGCELDSDYDGVVDRLDRCPNTSPDVKVNKDGCVSTVDLKINFDYDSSFIKPQYNDNISEFADSLKSNPRYTATIEAHTDSRASDSYNMRLSERRAASTVNALKAMNINGSRLNAIGYGETEPIADNNTDEGRAANRRVIGLINE